jgi:hypothetical protein
MKKLTLLVSLFLILVLISAFPMGASAQTVSPEHAKRLSMHHEVPEDAYSPVIPTKTSPAFTSRSDVFFTTQVNINAFGQNILGDAANEPSITVDPVNPDRMMIGWRQFNTVTNNFRQAGYAYTTDGGLTWTFPGVIDPGVFRSDPVLDCDAEGNFYYNSLTVDNNGNYSCDVYRILDGGVVWDGGIDAQGGDKQWMEIDKTSGVGAGNIYSSWTSYYSICYPGFFTRSTNQGNSYENCVEVSGNPYWGTLAVGPDGAVYAVGSGEFGGVIVAKSTTAQNHSAVVSWDSYSDVNLDGEITGFIDINPQGLLGQAYIGVDHSNGPGQGNIYVVASVQRNSNNDPGDVMFAKSTNGGQTWSSPKRINTDLGTNKYQWFGTMSVAPNGRIDVVWLDNRDAPSGSYLSSLYYCYSTDEGENWSANERLSESFDPHVGWPNQQKMGDYFDMVSDEEGAHLAWANTLNNEQDVYYGRIIPQVTGIAEAGGLHNLSSLSSYPNPFQDQTTVCYTLTGTNEVELGVYDVYGKLLRILVNEKQTAGTYNVVFAAGNLPGGFYYCRLNAGGETKTTGIVILK